MAGSDEGDGAGGAPPAGGPPGRKGPLPKDVQEHLGRKLRSELRMEEGKPAYLGDTAVPAPFDTLIRKLEAGERGQRQGYEAVRDSLKRLAAERGGKKPGGEGR